jgi:hypothetical protein
MNCNLCLRQQAGGGLNNPAAQIARLCRSAMAKIIDRQNFARWADWFAVAVAVVLPWSATCTAVFIVLWLISLLGSWNRAERFREPWLAVGYHRHCCG